MDEKIAESAKATIRSVQEDRGERRVAVLRHYWRLWPDRIVPEGPVHAQYYIEGVGMACPQRGLFMVIV
jgi:hypothetical protein